MTINPRDLVVRGALVSVKRPGEVNAFGRVLDVYRNRQGQTPRVLVAIQIPNTDDWSIEDLDIGRIVEIVSETVSYAQDPDLNAPGFDSLSATRPRGISELAQWWHTQAETEIEAVVPKAIEYGSRDLVEMGHTLARLMGQTVNDAEATEIGIWFYTLGKIGRWTEAIRRGHQVSDDTLHDIAVYTKMAQRTRVVGGWPGTSWERDLPGFNPHGAA